VDPKAGWRPPGTGEWSSPPGLEEKGYGDDCAVGDLAAPPLAYRPGWLETDWPGA